MSTDDGTQLNACVHNYQFIPGGLAERLFERSSFEDRQSYVCRLYGYVPPGRTKRELELLYGDRADRRVRPNYTAQGAGISSANTRSKRRKTTLKDAVSERSESYVNGGPSGNRESDEHALAASNQPDIKRNRNTHAHSGASRRNSRKGNTGKPDLRVTPLSHLPCVDTESPKPYAALIGSIILHTRLPGGKYWCAMLHHILCSAKKCDTSRVLSGSDILIDVNVSPGVNVRVDLMCLCLAHGSVAAMTILLRAGWFPRSKGVVSAVMRVWIDSMSGEPFADARRLGVVYRVMNVPVKFKVVKRKQQLADEGQCARKKTYRATWTLSGQSFFLSKNGGIDWCCMNGAPGDVVIDVAKSMVSRFMLAFIVKCRERVYVERQGTSVSDYAKSLLSHLTLILDAVSVLLSVILDDETTSPVDVFMTEDRLLYNQKFIRMTPLETFIMAFGYAPSRYKDCLKLALFDLSRLIAKEREREGMFSSPSAIDNLSFLPNELFSRYSHSAFSGGLIAVGKGASFVDTASVVAQYATFSVQQLVITGNDGSSSFSVMCNVIGTIVGDLYKDHAFLGHLRQLGYRAFADSEHLTVTGYLSDVAGSASKDGVENADLAFLLAMTVFQKFSWVHENIDSEFDVLGWCARLQCTSPLLFKWCCFVARRHFYVGDRLYFEGGRGNLDFKSPYNGRFFPSLPVSGWERMRFVQRSVRKNTGIKENDQLYVLDGLDAQHRPMQTIVYGGIDKKKSLHHYGVRGGTYVRYSVPTRVRLALEIVSLRGFATRDFWRYVASGALSHERVQKINVFVFCVSCGRGMYYDDRDGRLKISPDMGMNFRPLRRKRKRELLAPALRTRAASLSIPLEIIEAILKHAAMP